jgi:hypothetical protein
MTSYRRRAALCAAAGSATRKYLCESLEGRVLLHCGPVLVNDPVIVVVEPVQDFVVDQILPYLWRSPRETLFEPHVGGNPAPSTEDLNSSSE